VPLLKHAQRRYSDAVTDEGQARGRDPNKLGVIPGKQMSGREKQRRIGKMNDARHYPDVGVAVVENVVDEGG